MYLFIVLAKIVEVSMATVRMVLITKGERKIGSILAFFEYFHKNPSINIYI